MTIVDDGSLNYHAQPSPDGRLVAFDSDRDGERGIYVANRDGSQVRRVSGAGYAAVPLGPFTSVAVEETSDFVFKNDADMWRRRVVAAEFRGAAFTDPRFISASRFLILGGVQETLTRPRQDVLSMIELLGKGQEGEFAYGVSVEERIPGGFWTTVRKRAASDLRTRALVDRERLRRSTRSAPAVVQFDTVRTARIF